MTSRTTLLTPQNIGRWYTVYMDNFYNGVSMSEHLLDRQVHSVGSLHNHRHEPREIRQLGNDKDRRMGYSCICHDVIVVFIYAGRIRNGGSVSRDNGKILVLAWKDNRLVIAISTKHNDSTTTITSRKNVVGELWYKHC